MAHMRFPEMSLSFGVSIVRIFWGLRGVSRNFRIDSGSPYSGLYVFRHTNGD